MQRKKSIFFVILFSSLFTLINGQTITKSNILSNPQSPQFARLIAGEKPNYFEVIKAFESYEKANPEKEHKQFRKKGKGLEFEEEENTDPWRFYFKRWQSTVSSFVKADGTISSVQDAEIQNYIKERQAAILKNINTHVNPTSPNGVNSLDWRLVGPDIISNSAGNDKDYNCNMYCVDFNLTTPTTGYAGTETGFIFKTTDYGNNWVLTGTGMVFGGGIRSIATDPSNANIVYACGGNSIYKSINGGTTWGAVFAIPGNVPAWNIRINPLKPQSLLIGAESGLYQSYDGGATFNLRLSGKVKGLQYKVGDTTQVFAFSMQPVATATFPTGNNNANIYKSNNGGVTFTNKTSGVYTYNLAYKYSYLATDLTVSAANPNKLYAILGGDAFDNTNTKKISGEIGVLQSSDAGETWSFAKGPLVAPNLLVFPWLSAEFSTNPYWQGDYNTWIVANPLNASEVTVGGLSGYKSTNAGVTWTNVLGYSSTYGTHPDHQCFFVSGNDLWICNDGGILKSTNFLATSPTVKSKGLTATELWGFGVGWNQEIFAGGRYHNGNLSQNNKTYPSGKFLLLGGGEAATGYVSPFDGSVHSSDINSYQLPNTLPGTLTQISKPTKFPNESYYSDWSNMLWHPNKVKTFFLGNGTGFWRTDDDGVTFKNLNTFSGNVFDFDIALSDSNYIYVTTQDNKIWVSANGGTSFSNITGIVSGGNYSISVNPVKPQECWVLVRSTSQVYKTINSGTTWTAVGGGNLTGKNCRELLVQADATDATCYVMCQNGGIYYQNSTTSGNWTASNNLLPAAHGIRRILPFYTQNKLYLASSIGVWEHDFINTTKPLANFASDVQKVECATDTVTFYSYSIADETSGAATYTWSFPGAASVNLSNPKRPKVTYSALGQYSASLTVRDGNGLVSATKTLTNFISFPVLNCCENAPAGWTKIDIGTATPASELCYKPSTGNYKITNHAAAFGGTSDNVPFIYKPLVGNGQIVARVKDVSSIYNYTGGIMLRRSLAATSSFVHLNSLDTRGVFDLFRSSDGANTGYHAVTAFPMPMWLKITRVGNTVTTYYSSNSNNWTAYKSFTITLDNTVYFGLTASGVDCVTNIDSVTVGTIPIPVCNGGSAAGCPAYDTIPGKAIDFPYSWQPVPVNITAPTNTYTVTGWIKPKGLNAAQSGILAWDEGYFFLGQAPDVAGVSDNQLEFVWNDNSANTTTWASGLFVPADKWSFVAMVIEPNRASLYLNDKVAIDATPKALSTITTAILGNSNNGYGYFQGQMDEITVWKRALSTNEIDSMRHLAKEKLGNRTAMGYDPALVSYFQFNDTLSHSSYNQIDSTIFSLDNGLKKVTSTAPIGAGTSARNLINATGTYNFGTTGVTLDFPATGTYPNGNVWVSKINLLPDEFPAATILPKAYWIIDNYGTNSSFSAMASLKINNALNVSLGEAAAPNTFKLYKRGANDFGNIWGALINTANTAIAGAPGNLTFAPANITGSNQLFVNGTGVPPVPVKLLSFTGEKQNFHSLLNWKVTFELNFNYYELQHSTDGIAFDYLKIVVANNSLNYNYIDNYPKTGKNYYRLKMLANDGSFTYSNIVELEFDDSYFIRVSPNPVKKNHTLVVSNEAKVEATVSLYLADGKLYKTFIIAPTSFITLSNLPVGLIVYWATNKSNKKVTGKLIVQ